MVEGRLSLEDGKFLVELARKSIKQFFKTTGPVKAPKQYPHSLKRETGVFCTLYTHPEHKLRGCIGLPYPSDTLIHNTIEAACSSTQDPRFPRMTSRELKKVVIELSILTEPKLIEVEKPQDYLKDIVIGKDGLIIKYGYATGLLLPQVPIEWKWDVKEYLQNLCLKAALPPDMWVSSEVKIYRFETQVFAEKEPEGKVVEVDVIKKLGSRKRS